MASGKRARDSDRESVVGVLHDAFVDGQLDPAEHERRVEVALASAYVDDLRPLLDDLQVETPAALAVPGPAPSPKRPTAAHDDAASRRATWGALAVIVATAVIGGAVWLGVRGGDDTPDTSGAPAAVEVAQQVERARQLVQWSEVELTPGSTSDEAVVDLGLGEWRADERKLQAFLTAWQATKGHWFTSLDIRSDTVTVEIPTSGTGVRIESWTHGRVAGAVKLDRIGAPVRDGAAMDLRDLDVAALFDNIGRAIEDMGLEDGALSYVSISISAGDGLPSVSIYAKNPLQELAWLQTTLSGSVLNEYPFDG